MKIVRTYNEAGMLHEIKITFSDNWLCKDTRPLPAKFKALLTPEQSFGIIADAVLMANGLEFKKQQPAQASGNKETGE